ncbi:MAG: CDP-6-deoxy-delta-3,4-glucoseen reductase, partial [Gammaproteobacteria bacterium]|nr:CDP-6-deoxy-delta-3,4-glucoseen reductase [Gammaproteobacteria bacterium]
PVEGEEGIELHIRLNERNEYLKEIFAQAKQQGVLKIKAPYGKVIYRQEPNLPFIFVAGGTGFVPIKALIEQALMQNDQRKIFLYWGVKTSQQYYLQELIDRWAKNIPNFQYIPVVSEANDAWQGKTGLVHDAVLSDHNDLSEFQVYVSGPPDMVLTAQKTFLKQGLKPQYIYSDTFELFADEVH